HLLHLHSFPTRRSSDLLIPINIPRLIDNQGLMLEQYRFVPFNEATRFEMDSNNNKLDEYIEACSNIVAKIIRKYGLEKKFGGLVDRKSTRLNSSHVSTS